ncbi:hypothetical protein GGR51DRAFT_472042 [Nemania sp. FL0031]|nr:hypothetical protein GGR51DRAFT_472042 [Nemania sp. FL0031]
MDPPLKEKIAFFEQLDACRNCDEESDALSAEEEALRQKCKAFFTAAATAAAAATVPDALVPAPPASQLKLQGLRHARTASDPTLRLATDGLEIIAVTPRNDRRGTTASSPVLGATTGDSIVPETELPRNRRFTQRKIQPSTRVLRSQSNLESSSPSIAMVKRKRDKPLQMAPESKQIFRGLRFFYLPNDDINPARKLRITRAREHGATWTRDSTDATHVIVDKDLSYADIERFIVNGLTPSSMVLVNDRYPIECLSRGVVFDPNPTVERYQYKVPGDPGLTSEETLAQISSQDSDTSLPINPRRNARNGARATPESSQKSSDLIPSSYPEPPSPKPEVKRVKSIDKRKRSRPADAEPTPTFTDELATCIDAVLDDPEKHQYLDESDAEPHESEDEGPSKKKINKGRPRPRENNRTKFVPDNFMCMRGGTKDKKRIGPNADTIKILEEMAEEHNLSNETWRVQSYRKAVATLRRQPRKITTAKEAAALPNIGANLAGHIEEIVRTGHFEKLDRIRSEPSRAALKLFCNVYGVGVPTAKRWVELGYRTLEDLRKKAKLTTNQQIGLEHYEDLLTRIPRAEVKALGDHVKDAAAAIDSSVELIIGGSYRRGADSSGDIDILITKAGTSSTADLESFLTALVSTLTKRGFLTAALAAHRHGDGGNKWHGCCVLPESLFPGSKKDYKPIWRRIDLLLVPDTEIGAALVYFTGNDLFNRSMRLLARKKKMKLNHRALSGLGVHEGRDEKKIFEILGVQWREPHERWC